MLLLLEDPWEAEDPDFGSRSQYQFWMRFLRDSLHSQVVVHDDWLTIVPTTSQFQYTLKVGSRQPKSGTSSLEQT